MILRFLFFLSIATSCLAADSTFVNTTAVPAKKFSIIPVPIIGYAPETRWIWGAATGIFARFDTTRPSTILALTTYSQNDQFRLYLNPDLYFGPWHTVSELEMRRWPDSYWGIGNHTSERDHETYTARDLSASVNVQKKLGTAIGVGIQYNIESITMLHVESARQLDNPASRHRKINSGPGVIAFYDTRDNIYSPGRGAYCSVYAGASNRAFGSNSNYRSGNADLRGYWSLHGSHILAAQAWGAFAGGDPPFTELPAIGNEYRLRAYPWGRFRDMNAVTAQIEYRFPIYWQIRGGLFAGAGDVSDKISHFSRPNFKHSLGGGLRWMILPKDKVCLRFDKAWGQRMDAVYLALNEAF